MKLGPTLRLFASTVAALATPSGACEAARPMPAALTITDTQDGVAGPTGVVWTLRSDCSFAVARQIGSTTMSPHRQGRLTSSQWARLGDLVSKLTEGGFPGQIGKAPRFNARRITLSQGKTLSVLLLAPGSEDAGALEPKQVDAAANMLLLARALREVLGP